MTLAEQCTSCADFDFCQRAYSRWFIFRAQGWRPEWKPDDGNAHPVGCRHYRKKEKPNDE